MGKLEIAHSILIKGPDFETCSQQVRGFFDKTTLLRYDEVLIMENETQSGSGENFWAGIEDGLASNRKVLEELLENLKTEGFLTLDDLRNLERGYLSKVLHIIAHLQDGFIGIDSRFYNLEEDSHGVSMALRQKIQATPENYWLISVKGKIAATSEDPLDALRTFEGRDKDRG